MTTINCKPSGGRRRRLDAEVWIGVRSCVGGPNPRVARDAAAARARRCVVQPGHRDRIVAGRQSSRSGGRDRWRSDREGPHRGDCRPGATTAVASVKPLGLAAISTIVPGSAAPGPGLRGERRARSAIRDRRGRTYSVWPVLDADHANFGAVLEPQWRRGPRSARIQRASRRTAAALDAVGDVAW